MKNEATWIDFKYFVTCFYLCCLLFQVDYLFGGASRYVPIRITLLAIPFVLLFYFRSMTLDFLLWLVFFSITFLSYMLIWVVFEGELMLNSFLGGYGFVYLSIPLMYFLLRNISRSRLEFVIYLSLKFAATLLLIEAFFRYSNPTLGLSIEKTFLNSGFYYYKYSSVLFLDSNYTGIFAFLCFALSLYLKKATHSKLNIYLFSFAVFVFLSLSRASILAMMLLFFLAMFNYKKIEHLLLVIILTIFFFCMLYFGVDFSDLDGSLQSKLKIFYSMFNEFGKQDLVSTFFGAGTERGGYVYSYLDGKYAHALIPLVLGEVGVIGLGLYMITLAICLYPLGWFGVCFFITLQVQGLSLYDPYQPFVFVSIILMTSLKKENETRYNHINAW